MASRIIEERWKCAECGSIRRGRERQCPNDGSPREKGEIVTADSLEEYDERGYNKAETVSDPELLAMATAGADWYCSHCSSGNPNRLYGLLVERCSVCGAPRYGNKDEDAPGFEVAHESYSHPEEPSVGVGPVRDDTPPPTPRQEYHRPQNDDFYSDPPRSSESYTPPASKPPYLFIGGAVAAVGVIIMIIVWVCTTHSVTGQVSAKTWSRSVATQHWTQVQDRLWEHQTTQRTEIPPVAGSGGREGYELIPGSCSQEVFDHEQYVCGSHVVDDPVYRNETESYSCDKTRTVDAGETCSSNGNGFKTCRTKTRTEHYTDSCTRSKRVLDHTDHHTVNDYCTRPIYKDRCTYKTQEWRSSGSYPTSGTGSNYSWATSYPQTDLDRATFSADYTVTVSYTDDGKSLSYEIKDSASNVSKSQAEAQAARVYETWVVGAPVYMEINNIGSVTSTQHTPKQ